MTKQQQSHLCPWNWRDLPAVHILAMAGILLLAACGSDQAAGVNLAEAEPDTVQEATDTPEPANDAPPPQDDGDGEAATTPADAPATPTQEPEEPTPTDQPDQPNFNPDDVEVSLQPVIQGLNQPLYVTGPGDGTDRLFVVERPGRILVYGADRSQSSIFLDLSQQVATGGSEQGLLGLAFSPNYAESSSFFVNYTDRQGDTVISRFQTTDDPNVADPQSEIVILTLDQPARNHNGGMLLFGPDGYLYVGTGDGGRANDAFDNAQNPNTLLGAMLRLDVTSQPESGYTIPPENPWVEQQWNGQDVRDEIWAIGLRNPWRYSFDRETGDLWISDVGQNQYEEINLVLSESVQTGGFNFGWPIVEGLHCFQSGNCNTGGLTMPVIEYGRSGGHCSVTGGYVYRGTAYPELDGVYLYADYCSGTIWTYWENAEGQGQSSMLMDTELRISSFGQDARGELYLTDLSGGGIYQIQAAAR